MTRRILPVAICALAALGVLLALAFWQLQRLEWKESLIAAVEARVSQPAMPILQSESWSDFREEALIYQPVTATGRYLDETFYIFTTISKPQNGQYAGQGYWVLTPLEQADGSVVFVNRGFLPIDMKDAFDAAPPPSGEVEVTGLIKPNEPPAFFTPAPSPERALFYSRDVNAMAAAAGLGERQIAPFYIDSIASGEGGLPQGGETVLTFPNSHLGYALTWFGLALTLIGVAGVFIWRIVREERAKTA